MVSYLIFLALLARSLALAQDRSSPGLSQEEPISKPLQHGRTHLVSFRSCSQNITKRCNREFFEELSRLSALAAKVPSIGLHHLFQGYPPELEADRRWAKHRLEGVKGRGYWFWKPAILNLLLRNGTITDGDTVVWADADVEEYFTGRDPERGWNAWLLRNELDIFVQYQKFCEALWTKGDIWQRFKVPWWDVRYGLTPQAYAQFFILKVNARTRRFLQLWEELMTDFHLVSDEHSKSEDPPYFIQPRHDQSILSLLVKASRQEKLPFLGDCEGYAQHAGRRLDIDYDRGLHPEFGIANLSANVSDFNIEREEAAQLDTKRVQMQRRQSSLERAKRRLCVQGSCYDLDQLDAYPKEIEG